MNLSKEKSIKNLFYCIIGVKNLNLFGKIFFSYDQKYVNTGLETQNREKFLSIKVFAKLSKVLVKKFKNSNKTKQNFTQTCSVQSAEQHGHESRIDSLISELSPLGGTVKCTIH